MIQMHAVAGALSAIQLERAEQRRIKTDAE